MGGWMGGWVGVLFLGGWVGVLLLGVWVGGSPSLSLACISPLERHWKGRLFRDTFHSLDTSF